MHSRNHLVISFEYSQHEISPFSIWGEPARIMCKYIPNYLIESRSRLVKAYYYYLINKEEISYGGAIQQYNEMTPGMLISRWKMSVTIGPTLAK